MINQLQTKNNKGVNEMSLWERACKSANEKIVENGQELNNKFLAMNFTRYVSEYFIKEKTEEEKLNFITKICCGLYTIQLLRDWVIDDRTHFLEDIGWCLNLLEYKFDELIEEEEDLSCLDDTRMKILKNTWSMLDKTIKDFGIEEYKGCIQKGSSGVLINHFISDVCNLDLAFYSGKIRFDEVRDMTLVKAIWNLKSEGLKVYQGFITKKKVNEYTYLTAMANVVIEEDSDIVKVELF